MSEAVIILRMFLPNPLPPLFIRTTRSKKKCEPRMIENEARWAQPGDQAPPSAGIVPFPYSTLQSNPIRRWSQQLTRYSPLAATLARVGFVLLSELQICPFIGRFRVFEGERGGGECK
jgi:hypothetical protein